MSLDDIDLCEQLMPHSLTRAFVCLPPLQLLRSGKRIGGEVNARGTDVSHSLHGG